MSSRLARYGLGIVEAGWLLALVKLPLLFNTHSERIFEAEKVLLLRCLALLVLGGWALGLRRGGRDSGGSDAYSLSPGLLVETGLAIPVAAVVAVQMAATALSLSPRESLFGSYHRLQGLGTTLSYLVLSAAVLAHVRSEAQVRRILTAAIVTSLPVGLYGILQRLRLDPLPWSGETALRVAGSMGHPSFLAAYLMMIVPITVGRLVLTAREARRGGWLPGTTLLLAGYASVLAVDLSALWLTGSRGPWLGLLTGLFLFVVLLSMQRGRPRLALGALALGGILATLLVLFNVPGGPLEAWRDKPRLGRLAGLLDFESGTVRGRVVIWSAVVELMKPHASLESPDGRTDPWHVLRPVIGYGPETLAVALQPFAPPELAHLETPQGLPDRAHNETFDALAAGGLLGLAASVALFVSILHHGPEWLGIPTPRASLALILGGGALGAIALVRWQGPAFFGIGLPLGLILGFVVLLTLSAVDASPPVDAEPRRTPEPERAIVLVSLFSAVVAHLVEIQFGIATTSTRTCFWIFLALLALLGTRPPARAWSEGRGGGVAAGLTAGILLTLAYDFLQNPWGETRAGRILIESFTAVASAEGGPRSFAVLALVLAVWLVGGTLLHLEERSRDGRRSPMSLGSGLGLSLALAGVGGLLLSHRLGAIAAVSGEAQAMARDLAGGIEGLATFTVAGLFALVLGLGAALAARRGEGAAGRRSGALWGFSASAALVCLVLYGILGQLRVLQADMLDRAARRLSDVGQPSAAFALYDDAIRLNPGEDRYPAQLAWVLMNVGRSALDPAERDALFARAEASGLRGRGLSPLKVDQTALLARLNFLWASLTTERPIRARRAAKADLFYEQALRLRPLDPILWDEWAALALETGDAAEAQARLDRSLDLDPNLEEAHRLRGALEAWRARLGDRAQGRGRAGGP